MNVEPIPRKRTPSKFEILVLERFVSILNSYMQAASQGILAEMVQAADELPNIPTGERAKAVMLPYVEISDRAIAAVEEWLKWIRHQRRTALDSITDKEQP